MAPLSRLLFYVNIEIIDVLLLLLNNRTERNLITLL